MPKKSVGEPSFEKLYAELESVVEKLEAGNLTLAESLALFQRGMELAKECGALLDSAELAVKELAPVPNDEMATAKFDDEAGE